jgi:hypothetical protein
LRGEYKKVKYQNKSILLFIMFFMFLTMSIGCNGINPIIPGIDPNPVENPDNSIVSYIEVTTSSTTIKVNQSQKLVVRGYNSDDEWVILDKTKIKFWIWSAPGQCYVCVKPYVTLTPQSSSLTTTFTSGVTGTFFIGCVYQENVGADPITDDTEIKVVN